MPPASKVDLRAMARMPPAEAYAKLQQTYAQCDMAQAVAQAPTVLQVQMQAWEQPTGGVGLLYDARMVAHRDLESNHPEQPVRITRIFEKLLHEGLVTRCVRIDCREATRDELELKHTTGHVDRMLGLKHMTGAKTIHMSRDYNSVYLCPESTGACLLSAGSVIEAAAQVTAGKVRSAVCVVRPPGHHAEGDCAMGFCMFGNVALAAAEARRRGWSKRVLIVDWDVHHGNGTQRMFDEDPTVLYFSAHRHDEGKFFPGGRFGNYTSHGVGLGAGYSVNVPWDVQGGSMRGAPPPADAEFVSSFERVLLPIAEEFEPDLVLVSAGFDAALGDPIGGCGVTPAGYHKLTRLLMGLAEGRLVIALEGGYNLESTSAGMAACTAALLNDPAPPSIETTPRPDPFHEKTVDEVRRHLAQFWPSLRSLAEDNETAEPPPLVPDDLDNDTFEVNSYVQLLDASANRYPAACEEMQMFPKEFNKQDPVPQVQKIEKQVPVTQVQTVEKFIPVPQASVKEVVKEVPKVIRQEDVKMYCEGIQQLPPVRYESGQHHEAAGYVNPASQANTSNNAAPPVRPSTPWQLPLATANWL